MSTNYKPNCSIQPQASVCWSTACRFLLRGCNMRSAGWRRSRTSCATKASKQIMWAAKARVSGPFASSWHFVDLPDTVPRISEWLTSGASPKTRQYNISGTNFWLCRIHSWQNNPIPISVCKFAGYTNNQKKEKISPDEPPISNLKNTIAIPALYSKAGPEKSSIWVAKAEKSWSIWVCDWGRMRSGALWECSKPLSKTDGCGNFVESLYIRGDRVVLPRFWNFNNIGKTFVFIKLSLRFLINLLAQSRWLETRSLFAVWFHRELLASFALVFRSCLLARLMVLSRSLLVSVSLCLGFLWPRPLPVCWPTASLFSRLLCLLTTLIGGICSRSESLWRLAAKPADFQVELRECKGRFVQGIHSRLLTWHHTIDKADCICQDSTNPCQNHLLERQIIKSSAR